MTNLLDTARSFAAAGYCPVPARPDGTKAPAAFWKRYQQHQPTDDEVTAWFGGGTYDGLGLVCGAVSGNLELLELEGRAVAEGHVQQLADALTAHGMDTVWTRLNVGYLELTPSGGLHWLYRVDGAAARNLKLARRPATVDELEANPADAVKVLIETRGEGGYVVVAPSAGRTHDTGGSWRLVAGGVSTIPTLSEDERDALHAVAATLDRVPAPEPAPHPTAGAAPGPAGGRPGDDYNTRADWADILEGWTRVRPLGDGWTWRRPGKDRGISATTGTSSDGADRLYVFSSSTEFQTETPYSKFGAYALLQHDGDHSAAARDLRRAGYGAPLEPTRRVEVTDLIAPTDGTAALHSEPRPSPVVTPIDRGQSREPRALSVVEERTYERSDDGNALALIDRFADHLRYCPDRGRWLAWDGQRWHWCPPNGGVAREYAKRIARALPDADPPAVKHKQRSLGAGGTSAMLTQAETDSRITVSFDELDAHPWDLNTPAGIVDLRTGRLGPADPARLHTRVTKCAPADSSHDDHAWSAFLADTFGEEETLISYLQRLVGYSAVGIVGPHVLPFCHGSGGNGKGVFLESVTAVLGDYATTAPSGFLMAHAFAQHETEIARLAGARMVLCSEVNEDDRFDEAKVKQLTGGDTLTARFMRQDHFTFRATHQLWLMGNSRPAVKAGGNSFWRRLRLIGFEREVPEEKQVDDLQGLLSTEHGPTLLRWIIDGAADYYSAGLREPESVRVATAEYAKEEDTAGRFIDERCIIGGGEHVKLKVSAVRAAYEAWCLEEGAAPVTAKAFGMAMQRCGVEVARTKAARFYVGVSLVPDEEHGDV